MYKYIIPLFLILGSYLGYNLASTNQENVAEATDEWISLFNGKDLEGWDIKIAHSPLNENYRNTFRVEDGMLRVTYVDYDKFDRRFGHIYYEKPYSHYIMEFDYRFQGEMMPDAPSYVIMNSGVMIHSQSAASNEIGQEFPVSLEMQLLAGLSDGKPRPTGNICTPGTLVHMDGELRPEHCINSTSKTYDGEQWVSARIEVYGDSLVRHIVEGDTVLVYEDPLIGGGYVGGDMNWESANITKPEVWLEKDNTPLGTGYIALQAEGQGIDFKNIRLLNLKKE